MLGRVAKWMALAVVWLMPLCAHAQIVVTSAQFGAWDATVRALQNDPESQGRVLSLCVRSTQGAPCTPCDSYALALDDVGARAFRIDACNPADATTRVVLVDRDALFSRNATLTEPRAVTMRVTLSASATGGAPIAAASDLACSGEVRPVVRDSSGALVALTPGPYDLYVSRDDVSIEPRMDTWTLWAASATDLRVDYSIVERASGQTVLRAHAVLACSAEVPTAPSVEAHTWMLVSESPSSERSLRASAGSAS